MIVERRNCEDRFLGPFPSASGVLLMLVYLGAPIIVARFHVRRTGWSV